MNLGQRQQRFLNAAQAHFGTTKAPRELFGVSNSAKIIEGGIQFGVVNLENVRDDGEAVAFACVLRFPPEDEVYFAVLVRRDKAKLVERLTTMKRLGAGAGDDDDDEDAPGSTAPTRATGAARAAIQYRSKNNNVPLYLARDGQIWLRNKGFWDTLDFDRSALEPSVEPDEVVVSLYPPTASARRSLLAREFIGWLGKLVGVEKIHELNVWDDAATLSPEMRRMPSALPVADIEAAVAALGGHYPNGEVRRFHAALNFLDYKHFVILSGLSGTGKTQLALKYARAVHGLTSETADDPLLFVCPVRPEWTDPTGLTGYNDVLKGQYVVPPFLEAVLVATAHRESPVFVILDELNLARVEYYLSDVLSAIETRSPLQLHSESVPLEGTTGTSIRAELALPPNLYIIGTINIDETTNPVSDKVLDRASVIDMSQIDLPGFLAGLEARYPELNEARARIERTLTDVLGLMQQHGLGFGYRVIEECVRYHAYHALHLQTPPDDVTDQLLEQKILVKLRGGERERPLLMGIEKVCGNHPKARRVIQQLVEDLDAFGSFQAMR